MESELNEIQKQLLAAQGITGDYSVNTLKGGKNNVVYKVSSDNRSVILKKYFQHQGDSRDRGATEYAFSSFAWSCGLRNLPEPMVYDAQTATAIYEFVEGERVKQSDITKKTVDEALAFISSLNYFRASEDSYALKNASEACFSIGSHLECIDARVDKLGSAVQNREIDQLAKDLVLERLLPVWHKTRHLVLSLCDKFGFSPSNSIKAQDRIISPSDFGFHNALKRPNGKLCFLDFEYAGWDDLAKTICDFFLQPALPVAINHFGDFAKAALHDSDNPETVTLRASALFPAYQVKWCCILLNDFLPVGNDRRKFSLGEDKESVRKKRQLALASSYLTGAENDDKLQLQRHRFFPNLSSNFPQIDKEIV